MLGEHGVTGVGVAGVGGPKPNFLEFRAKKNYDFGTKFVKKRPEIFLEEIFLQPWSSSSFSSDLSESRGFSPSQLIDLLIRSVGLSPLSTVF